MPAILSSAEPALESAAVAEITAVAGGVLPPSIASELPAVVSEVVPQLESGIDNYVTTRLPGSASLVLLPSAIAADLPSINSVLAGQVSAYLPAASSYLTQYAGAISSYEAAAASGGLLPTGFAPSGFNASGGGAPTGTGSPIPIATGAAAKNTWVGGVAGVAMAVVAVAML